MFSVPPVAAAQVVRFDRSEPAAAGLDATTLIAVDSLIDRSLPALLGMAVLRRDRLVWERYWHGADSATVLNAKSVAKSVIGALVGIAVKEGRLSLDQTVASLLPAYYTRARPAPNLMFRRRAEERLDSSDDHHSSFVDSFQRLRLGRRGVNPLVLGQRRSGATRR